MAEKVMPGPVSDLSGIREATCVHTRKIYDSCQSKDCVEDLRLYPTASSQAVIDQAQSVKAGRAELLHVFVDVQPMGFNRGFYTVDLRYFYRVTCDAFNGCSRPVQVTGLAVFSKRSVLFGSEGAAKIFTSENNCADLQALTMDNNLPIAICEAVDPLVLNIRLVNVCECPRCCEAPLTEIPAGILSAFDEEIALTDSMVHRVYLTLGQFSILRLERDTQLLIPVCDYCMPDKECACDGCEDDPCEIFQQVDFPVGEFFPPNTADAIDPLSEFKRSCCK